jgi:arginyl-tRNA synthetase
MRNLVKLPDVLGEVEADLYPNRLCDYLFETSQKFNQVSLRESGMMCVRN